MNVVQIDFSASDQIRLHKPFGCHVAPRREAQAHPAAADRRLISRARKLSTAAVGQKARRGCIKKPWQKRATQLAVPQAFLKTHFVPAWHACHHSDGPALNVQAGPFLPSEWSAKSVGGSLARWYDSGLVP